MVENFKDTCDTNVMVNALLNDVNEAGRVNPQYLPISFAVVVAPSRTMM